jgi:hypothetical protein
MKAKLKKPLLVAGVASSLAVAGIGGSSIVSAATTSTSSSSDPTSSLVSKLASKFNLNKSDVQAVFDEDRTARDAERQQKVEAELSQAVTDGKLTADQKTKILAKIKEVKATMEANRDSMKDKTEAELKSAMDSERTSLESWAKENNIPTEYLRLLGPGGGHGGPGGPGSPRGQ